MPSRKICALCKKKQPLSNYTNGETRCRKCNKKRAAKRYKESPEKCRAVALKSYHKHREERLKQNKERDKERKDIVFTYYGGYVCACCGEDEETFLTIDHIENDGAAHRKAISGQNRQSGQRLYRWIVKNGFPEGFQVLCMNCNFGKHQNGGVCPHEK